MQAWTAIIHIFISFSNALVVGRTKIKVVHVMKQLEEGCTGTWPDDVHNNSVVTPYYKDRERTSKAGNKHYIQLVTADSCIPKIVAVHSVAAAGITERK